MTRRASRWAPLAPAALLVPLLVGFAYLDGPPSGRTGGFGEPTCRECHFDGPEHDPSTSVRLEGVPDRWTEGAAYDLRIVLVGPHLAAGGFQLAARYAGGSNRGRQAGELAARGDRVAVVDSAGIAYAQHTSAGTRPSAPDTIGWVLQWTAPSGTGGAVVFHVAANAANGDDSELGDVIVTERVRVKAPCEAKRGRGG